MTQPKESPGNPGRFMARHPFKPTEQEARAIQHAEEWWAQVQHVHELIPSVDVGAIVALKANCSALLGQLQAVCEAPRNGGSIALFSAMMDAELSGVADVGADALREVLGQYAFDRQEAKLNDLLTRLQHLANALGNITPDRGNKSNPDLLRFVYLAADFWWLNVTMKMAMPTGSGRFYKAIQDVARDRRLKDVSPKALSIALRKWAKERGIATPKSSSQ